LARNGGLVHAGNQTEQPRQGPQPGGLDWQDTTGLTSGDSTSSGAPIPLPQPILNNPGGSGGASTSGTGTSGTGASGTSTSWLPLPMPTDKSAPTQSPQVPAAGTNPDSSQPGGGTASAPIPAPTLSASGSGSSPAPAPAPTGTVAPPTDTGGSALSGPQPTLVVQPQPQQAQQPQPPQQAQPPAVGVPPGIPSGSAVTDPVPSTSGSDLTGMINSLAGRLGSLMGSRPDTSAFSSVPKVQAPAPAKPGSDGTASPTGAGLTGSGDGLAGGFGRSPAAPGSAPGGAAGDAQRGAALDKMVGEIASLPDARTAAQRQSAAAVLRAKTQMALEKDFRGALESLNRAVRFDPDNIQAYILRAEVYSKLHRYDDALADAKEAIRRDPKNGAAWDEAAWANFKAGRYQDAIEAATRALFLNPNDAVALAIRARARWATGDKAGALADARAAARLDSRFAALAEAMAKGAYVDDGELLDDAAQVHQPLERSLPWTALLGLSALLLAGLGGLAAFLTRKRRPGKVRTFSSLARPSNGRLAGKYELKSILGKGGMGSVHEAFDHTLKRTVAVKKMAEGLTEVNPQAKELLVREAQTVAALRHPNIVDIYEIIDEAGDLYLVFELVRGKTLSQLLAEKGALPLERCGEILKPVCQALQFAHKQELVHRDLKPGNIMLAEDGFVKLMDFGIARETGAAPVEPGRTPAASREIPLLARTKMVMGTPRYMAPEMEYGVVSKQGDVYALGVCLYEMLTGRFPFETNDEKLELRFVPPSQLVPGLTRRVDALLREALDPDPARRLRTPMIFYGRLYAALQPGETPPSALPAF
jgi:tetratricopeptide (TPR) repeat protein